VLAVISPFREEALLQSEELSKAGIEHELFGFPVAANDFFQDPAAFDRPARFGRFNMQAILRPNGEPSARGIAELRERGFDRVTNAGTFTSLAYAIAHLRSRNELWLPPRFQFLSLEDDLAKAGLECVTLTEVFEARRRELMAVTAGADGAPSREAEETLAAFASPAPDPGFADHAVTGDLDPADIARAVADAREHLADEAYKQRHSKPWLGRVAATVLWDGGVDMWSDTHTDPFLFSQKHREPRRRHRLLIKLVGENQARLDPSGIGSGTVRHARAAHAEGIILAREGIIFDKLETLRNARQRRAPIYGV